MSNKKIGAIATFIVLVVFSLLFFVLCTVRIKPGYVGIQYSQFGGIQETILCQGRRIVKPWIQVKQYTVATEQGCMSKDSREGSENDESFNISSKDDKSANIDIEFSYRYNPELLPKTYTNYKGLSGKEIEQTYMKVRIKALCSEVTTKFTLLQTYGSEREKVNKAILQKLQQEFAPKGIVMESVSLTRIGLDKDTEKAIQQRINKQQELEVARIQKEKAEIEATEKLVKAKADADAKIIEAKGQSEANREIQKSISPELLKKMEMEARIRHGWVEVQGANPVVIKK